MAGRFTGVGFMILGALSVGVSFGYAKRFITPLRLSPLALTTYQLRARLVILVLITDFTDITNISSEITTLLANLIGLGLLGTGAAYLCYYFIIEKLSVLGASTVTYIPPVIALLIGTALLISLKVNACHMRLIVSFEQACLVL